MEWYIGCSGFYYKEWKNIFYQGLPASQWLEHYCRHFATVEINHTFYRFPEKKHLQDWYKRTTPAFVFSVKVPQIISHQKKFEGTEHLLKEFYEVVFSGLQDKLGPLLFQLPPRMPYSPEILFRILAQLDTTFINVLEFRHNTWWRQEVFDALRQQNITFCSLSYPGLPNETMQTGPVVYYRFHGVPQLYRSLYPETFLENKIMQISSQKEIKKAFVSFNNTASGAALINARFVQEITKNRH